MKEKRLYLQGGDASPTHSAVAQSVVDDLEARVIVGGHHLFDSVVSRPAADVVFLVMNGIPIPSLQVTTRARQRVVRCTAEEFVTYALEADAFLLCPPTDHPACIPLSRIVADVLFNNDRPRRIALVGWNPLRLLDLLPEDRRGWFATFSLETSDLWPVIRQIRDFLTRR